MGNTKFIQDLLEVDQVVGSMMKMKDGRYIRVAEVTPVNFLLMEDQYQNSIISSFASWFKICPDSFQIKVIARHADAGRYLDDFEKHMKEEQSESMRAVYESFAQKVREIGTGNAVTRRCYIILEYSGGNVLGEADEMKAEKELSSALSTARTYFRDLGNAVIYPQDAGEDGLEYLRFYGDFLFMVFCRRSYGLTTYEDRAVRYYQDMSTLNEKNPGITQQEVADSVSLADVVAPHGADFSLQPDCYVMDGAYHTHMFIRGDSFPSRASSTWPVTTFMDMEGLDMDIHIRKIDRGQFLSRLKYGSRIARARAGSADETSDAYGSLLSSYQAIEYFRQAMRGDFGGVQQDAFEMFILLTVHARSYRELCAKREHIINRAVSSEMQIDEMRYGQEQGFIAAAPFNHVPKRIYARGKRNAATDGICSVYPFTGYELCDDHGIFIGQNQLNSSMCVLDVFDADKYPNANMCILGGSGSGKTFTLLLMAMRTRMLGNQCFLVTMEKPHEFKRPCTAMNGEYIKIGVGSQNCMNMMEIRPQKSDFFTRVYGYDEDYRSLVAEKAQDIVTWMNMMIPGLTTEEEQLLDTAVVRMYAKIGILQEDNSSIYIYPSAPEKGLKKMPVIGDLLAALQEDEDSEGTKRLRTALRTFTEGSASAFNQQTNVRLDNPFTVFDISGLPEKLQGPVTYQVISCINALMKEDPTVKQSVFIEEGWSFISSTANEKAARVIQEMWKTIRGYGGSACMCTQQMSDLTGSVYGQSVLSQSSVKLLLQMSSDEALIVQNSLKLSESETRSFTGARSSDNTEMRRKGTGLLVANSSHVQIVIEASEEEKYLISTDRRDLEEVRRNS